MPSGRWNVRFAADESAKRPYDTNAAFCVSDTPTLAGSQAEASTPFTPSPIYTTPSTPVNTPVTPGPRDFDASEMHTSCDWTPAQTPVPRRADFEPFGAQTPFGYFPSPGPIPPFIPVPDREQTDPATSLALSFCSSLFEGIAERHFTFGAFAAHGPFVWPAEFRIEKADQVAVALRAIRAAGFLTVGEFLAALFIDDDSCNKHPFIAGEISGFLQPNRDIFAPNPAYIVDLIFRHRKAQCYHPSGAPWTPNFDLPRHARPPSIRMHPDTPLSLPDSTRNALINWALQQLLVRVDRESDDLLLPQHGFLRRQQDPPLTWDMVLSWSMMQSEETVARRAPVIFAIMSRIAVNKDARARLEAKVHSSLAEETTDDEEQENDGPRGETPAAPPPIGRRNPWQAVTAFILFLLVFRNRLAIMLPLIIGIFAFTCNVNREFISVLCRLGISISYSSVLTQLHTLSADSAARIEALASIHEQLGPVFLLLYDNVNKMKRAWRATLGHSSEVKSGTAATVIRIHGARPGAFKQEPVQKAIDENRRGNLTVKQLRDDVDWTHIRGVGVGLLLRTWLKYIPALRVHRKDVEEIFTAQHAKHILELRKTEAHSLRPTNIDESTTVGTGEVLKNLLSQLALVPVAVAGWLVMVCGDQLTIDRLRKLKEYTVKHDLMSRHRWVLPVIQLWHLKWNWQKAIFRMHWHPEIQKDFFGLSYDCTLIDREKFNAEKCDFYPGHHILEDRFEALALDAFRLVLEETTSTTFESNLTLTDTLAKYFAERGPRSEISFTDLKALAETVYTRYMQNAASEAALGHLPRKTDIYGPAWSGVPFAQEAAAVSGATFPQKHAGKKVHLPHIILENVQFDGADQSLATTCNFMRATFWYLEMCAATAEGDIGRVFEIIKVLRFSFWGAGSTNYGNELLELACNVLYEWPKDLTWCVMENWLANPTGWRGYWLELDLLQEHWIFWLKNLFNSKSHDFDSKHLTEAVGLNIPGIGKLRESFPGLFGLKRNGQKHRKVTPVDDINQLGVHYRERHILSFDKTRSQPKMVSNEYSEGVSKMHSVLPAFLERTKDGKTIENDAEEREPDFIPPCAPTMVDGVLDVDNFITAGALEVLT